MGLEQIFILISVHSFISLVLYLLHLMKPRFSETYRKVVNNLIGIYAIYWIIMIGYGIDIIFWNFSSSGTWLEKFILVLTHPIDNFSAIVSALIIRAIFGRLEYV